jgi:plasmid replication initiation protein
MADDKRAKALQAIAKDPYRLIKSNPIVNAKYDITAIQMKAFLKIIASIDQSSDDTPLIQISVKEFQRFLGGVSNKNIYSYLEKELTKLRKKDIFYEDENIKLEASFFSSIEYKKKEGYFEFEISKKLRPFLLQLRENFTILDIRNLLYLDSVYAIRMYEFCKEFERFKTFEFGVDELKETFGLSHKYKNYYDFKKKVLHQARAELMDNSELYFDFEEIKNGRKIVRLKFTIIKNSKKLPRQDDEQSASQIFNEVSALVSSFLSENTVKAWFKKYPEEQIQKGVYYTLEQQKKGLVKDVAKYLQTMVATPDLFDPNEEQRSKQKRALAFKQKQQLELDLQKSKEDDLNKLKSQLYKAKKQLVADMLQNNGSFHTNILQMLRRDVGKSTNPITQSALKSYTSMSGEREGSQEEFLANFNQGNSFTGYVVSRLLFLNPESFNKLIHEYQVKADKLGFAKSLII